MKIPKMPIKKAALELVKETQKVSKKRRVVKLDLDALAREASKKPSTAKALAEHFEVSRIAIKRGLATLASNGVIQVSVAKGPVLGEPGRLPNLYTVKVKR